MSEGKNIVICLDGTGNQLKARGNTNVVRLFQMLDLSDRERQVAYYDPGVGTFAAPGAWTGVARRTSKLLGLAFGAGIKDNLEEAYTFLMQHYRPGDRVFLFGFSRGAYTARGLAGLTHRPGLMKHGAENMVPYLVKAYTKGDKWSPDDWGRIDEYAETFCVRTDGSTSMPVHFLGLWDSVKALGYLRWDPKWPYTRKVPNARTVRHAVSIDERRRPYAEYLVEGDHPGLREVWFAGVHSDVGGTFTDDARLSTIALKWMVDGALDHGILLRRGAYERACSVTEEHAAAVQHRMGWIWSLLTYRRRQRGADAQVHASVRSRLAAEVGYRFEPPGDDHWDDPEWLRPRGS
jgi:uncharacterized protein (DUF2235 family)